MENKTTYAVWDLFNAIDVDLADWYDTIEEAIEASKEYQQAYIMKYINDECAWDFGIVKGYDGYWSDDYSAREEMGCIQ
uniref:Uncharacterized protein n=1 Tax=Dulem virus 36 TaxID=3145754 RepID=A0AAU8B0B7_9CAUD